MDKERKWFERQAEIERNNIERKERMLLSSVKGCVTLRLEIEEFIKKLKDDLFFKDDLERDVDFFEDATPKEKTF